MHVGAITTKSLLIQNPQPWATPMCTSRWGHYHVWDHHQFFFLAFLPPFLYAHTLSVSTDHIRTPRLHYKTDVKITPPLFSHKLFMICCHMSSFSGGTNYMVPIHGGGVSLHRYVAVILIVMVLVLLSVRISIGISMTSRSKTVLLIPVINIIPVFVRAFTTLVLQCCTCNGPAYQTLYQILQSHMSSDPMLCTDTGIG